MSFRYLLRSAAFCLIVAFAALGAACSSHGVRALTKEEMVYFKKFEARVDQNRAALKSALGHLEELANDYERQGSSEEVDLARPKLLGSMANAGATDEVRNATLFQLYELANAEAAASDATQQLRREKLDVILEHYASIQALLQRAIQNEKTIFVELNQPASSQALRSAGLLLSEVKNFREELAKSDNPKLQALAAKVADLEEKASKALENIAKGLKAIQ
jgi:hypothetical protein